MVGAIHMHNAWIINMHVWIDQKYIYSYQVSITVYGRTCFIYIAYACVVHIRTINDLQGQFSHHNHYVTVIFDS